MLNKQKWLSAIIAMSIAPIAGAVVIGEGPNKRHIEQADIEAGQYTIRELVEHGRHIMFDDFNSFDGHGDPERPGINSQGVPTGFNRVSGGGDNTSCAHCHTKPLLGGAGDYAQSIYPEFNRPDGVNILGFEGLNVKNSKSIFGVGPKEMLGREMTADIKATTDQALADAASSGQAVRVAIGSKGTDFGFVTAHPDGTLDTHEVDGITHDLIVRPFVSVGAFDSLRTIVAGSMEQHFGVEAEELFGMDDDGDGVERELTVGDVTAATLFQASLFIPSEVRSFDPRVRRAVNNGRRTFGEIGCSDCHTPSMVLNDPTFTVSAPGSDEVVSLDLTRDSFYPRVKRLRGGRAEVRLYSDLKRHDMGAELRESVEEVERESHQHYLTMPLWGVANTGPWMHDGRATTMTEAILLHGGDSAYSRDNFNQLSSAQQDNVLEFLQSLRIVAKDLRYILTTLPLPGTASGSGRSASTLNPSPAPGFSSSEGAFGKEASTIGTDADNGDSFDEIVAGLEDAGAVSEDVGEL